MQKKITACSKPENSKLFVARKTYAFCDNHFQVIHQYYSHALKEVNHFDCI